MRVPFEQVKETIKKAFLNVGLTEEQAEECAKIHTQSSCDGVYSHGLNRVPRFCDYVKKGWVNPKSTPQLVKARGAAEHYDGGLGIGILNAEFCMKRAVALAKEHGIGMVALRNTTHWMRGGTYAWQAASEGFMGMCWINTESCMPLWGSVEPSVGNNPFCIGIPHKDGNIVLDMAMSQYAYGKLQVMRLAGKQLPYPGGFDKDGNLTSDPGAIEESMRILPTGYWKGSSMALVLDMAAAMLSGGRSGDQMDDEGRGSCTGCSQIFIAFDPYLFSSEKEVEEMLTRRIDRVHHAKPQREGDTVSYPGERTAATRAEHLANGVEVDESVWNEVCALAQG